MTAELDCDVCRGAAGRDRPDDCYLVQCCSHNQMSQTVECDADTCVCSEGHTAKAECPMSGVCGEGDWVRAMERTAEQCCGFDFNIG